MNTPTDRIESDDLPPSDEVRAGEYVLGVLDAAERRRVGARIPGEPRFAALVSDWERRFAPWVVQVAPVEPPAQAWPRIRSALGWSAVQAVSPRAWDRVGFWRGAAALAAAAGVAAFFIGRSTIAPPIGPAPPIAQEPAARPVTVLAHDDGSAGWIAAIDAGKGTLTMAPVPQNLPPPGSANELWLIPSGKSPRSLGFLSADKAHTIELPTDLRAELAAGAILAVTLESASGMPHAAPTSAIVARGEIRTL